MPRSRQTDTSPASRAHRSAIKADPPSQRIPWENFQPLAATCFVELALKGVLYIRLGSKGLRNNYQEGGAVKREGGAQCKLTALGRGATCKFLGKW